MSHIAVYPPDVPVQGFGPESPTAPKYGACGACVNSRIGHSTARADMLAAEIQAMTSTEPYDSAGPTFSRSISRPSSP